eukprot:2737166-Karenia_brevis.AAC.1
MQVLRKPAAQFQPAACGIQLGRSYTLTVHCWRPTPGLRPDPMTMTMCCRQWQRVATLRK